MVSASTAVDGICCCGFFTNEGPAVVVGDACKLEETVVAYDTTAAAPWIVGTNVFGRCIYGGIVCDCGA